MGKLTRTSTN